MLRIRFVSLVPFMVLSTAVSAQTVELRIPSGALEVGESVNVQLVCTNTGVPSTPVIPPQAGVGLTLLQPTPQTSSMSMAVGGRITQQTTYTFWLKLVGVQAGDHVVGPIRVVADGKPYETEPVKVTVQAASASGKSRGDSLIWVEIDAQPRSLYVSESLQAVLRIGIRKVEWRGRVMNLNLLKQVLDLGASQISIFEGGNARRGEESLRDSAGHVHRYEVFTVAKEVRAEHPGDLLIGPIFLKANYPIEFRERFFDHEVSKAVRETARAEAVPVKVLAPPTEGRPPDFAGAIGNFTMEVSAKPDRVSQGEPVTLTISLRGAPLEGLAGPDLSRHAELVSRFDFSKEELVGDLEGGAKVFRRAIFPKQQGEQTIPSISWSYFNPREGRYVTLSGSPIPLTVDPLAPGSVTNFFHEEMTPEETGLTLVAGGLSPNHVDVEEVLANQAFRLTPPWIATAVAPPVLYLSVLLTVKHRARLRSDRGFRRRRQASRRARALLNRARAEQEPSRRMVKLAEALTTYLSDRFDLPPGRLTPADARGALESGGAKGTLTKEILDFLEECETARYAAVRATEQTRPHSPEQVADWISRLERG